MAEIREIEKYEWEDAMALCWRVFLEFESRVYSEEGVRNFHNFVNDRTLHRAFMNGGYPVFAAYHGSRMVGVGALRNNTHLSLLFVDKDCQRNGIGAALIDTMRQYILASGKFTEECCMTVISSPYAVRFYHDYGFTDTEKVQYKDGIIYTPMKLYM